MLQQPKAWNEVDRRPQRLTETVSFTHARSTPSTLSTTIALLRFSLLITLSHPQPPLPPRRPSLVSTTFARCFLVFQASCVTLASGKSSRPPAGPEPRGSGCRGVIFGLSSTRLLPHSAVLTPRRPVRCCNCVSKRASRTRLNRHRLCPPVLSRHLNFAAAGPCPVRGHDLAVNTSTSLPISARLTLPQVHYTATPSPSLRLLRYILCHHLSLRRLVLSANYVSCQGPTQLTSFLPRSFAE